MVEYYSGTEFKNKPEVFVFWVFQINDTSYAYLTWILEEILYFLNYISLTNVFLTILQFKK